MKHQLFYLCMASMILMSCEKEKKDTVIPPPASSGELKGAFIINEGAFGTGNGAVSYLSQDGSYFTRDIYAAVNSSTLGDIVQSMYIYNGSGFIVVNNSLKVEVVSMTDFKSTATITGFSSPRFFLPVNTSKAYVSDWFSNTVKIINLNSMSISGSVTTGTGPEQMLMANNKVYITNTGGFGLDSTITIVDAANDVVSGTITIGINPSAMQKMADGKIAVLCTGSTGPDFTGGTADDLASSVVIINPVNDSIEKIFNLGQFVHPVKLVSNGNKSKFYFLYGSDGYTGVIKEINLATGMLTDIVNQTFYGLAINPGNGNIYAGRAGFSSNCYMLRYSENVQLIDSFLVGVGPNGCVFN